MPWTPVGSVAVVVAQHFNPTIIRESWLERLNVLTPADILPGSTFSDLFVQVRSREFNMFVVQEQLQFSADVPEQREQQVLVEKLGAIIRQLPETPYAGLGLNFHWVLTSERGDIPELGRRLFWRELPIYQKFADPSARFGAYLSKDFADFRLKLDIKPITVNAPEQRLGDRLQFSFNFHSDLTGENRAGQIIERLGRWNEVREEAEEIIDSVEPRVRQ